MNIPKRKNQNCARLDTSKRSFATMNGKVDKFVFEEGQGILTFQVCCKRFDSKEYSN